jgi:hypothetical protein
LIATTSGSAIAARKERLDGDERIERMVHQVVLVADLVEDRLDVVVVPQLPRREGRVLQLRAVQLLDGPPVAEAHAIGGADHDVLFDGEVLDQDVEDPPRHGRVDFEQRQRAVAQLLQPLVHRLEQVVGFVLLDHHVGVADDAEQVGAAHLGAGEQLVDVVLDDVFEEREGEAALGRDVLRHRHEARQHVGHLDARELGASAMLDHHCKVLAQVRDVRERMAGVERQRRQDGEDVGAEEVRQILVDRRREVGDVEEVNALGGQQRTQRLVPASRQAAHHRQRTAADGHQLLLGVQAVGREVLDAGAVLLQQRREPDHEELVEVRPADPQELNALEQRVGAVPRLGEHALVELEPGELAVEVQRRVRQVGRVDAAPVGRLDDRRGLPAAAPRASLPGHALGRAGDVGDARVVGERVGVSIVHERANLTRPYDDPVSWRRIADRSAHLLHCR